MINKPLRLRLRRTTKKAEMDYAYLEGFTLEKGQSIFTLEFENPLNGSWHPVEIYDETKGNSAT